MRQHLSKQELFDCMMLGDMDVDANRKQRSHLAECSQCAEELRRREASCARARVAVSSWVAEEQGSDTAFLKRLRERARSGGRRRVVQASAAVALLLAVVPTGLLEQRRAERRARQANQADEVLLLQVDQEISETVPDAMQPLASLIVWKDEGKTEERSSGTQPRTTRKINQ